MSSPALQHGNEAAPPGAADPVRLEVQEVVRGFAKALRTHLLYEGASPALDRFLETQQARMQALWGHLDRLVVQVEENDLRWEGVAVYHAEERADSLAFLLYRDGIRELAFHPEFETEELAPFVDVLARVQRNRGEEEDLLTVLWERDWLHLRYRYVEPLSEGVALPAPSGAAPRPVRPVAEVEPEPAVVSSISRDDFRETLYFLDEPELRRLEAELRGEMQRDLWTDVLNALFDRLQDGRPDRQEAVVAILSDVLPTLLGAGKLDSAAYVLREMVAVATARPPLPANALRGVRSVFEQLARIETVTELVRIVEQAGDGFSRETLSELLVYFPPDALAPLLRAGESASSAAVRAALTGAAERLGSANRDHLVKLVSDPDPAVVAGAARLIGRLKATGAAPQVAKLLARPETAVRLVAVEALQELKAPASMSALEGALEDADREVRVAAARALAALRPPASRERLEALLDSKRVREADLTERIAFFEAYGAVAGQPGVAVLERMLNGKSWLGRRETGEMRACAALGLGRIQHPSAEKALAAAAADPDAVVRSAVGRALRALRS